MQLKAQKKRVLGIDLGIASCGWALIELIADDCDTPPSGTITAAGVWLFDAPETDKERKPTNQIRRTNRGQRRVTDRRRQRMNAIRELFSRHGLLPHAKKDALKRKDAQSGRVLDPWRLRAEALDRLLTAEELAVALGHIARHRNFKSNKKSDGANKADESSKMLKAIQATRDRLAIYRTAGEMLARDPQFKDRKRNRDGDFSRSFLRADMEHEVRQIFAAQRRLGHSKAGETLEQAVFDIAFFQRPLQDSEDLLGDCPFVKDETRTAKRAPSFELFRFLSRLATLRIREGRNERPLTETEIGAAMRHFGQTKKFTYRHLRKQIDLPDTQSFAGVPADDEKNDVAARHGEAAFGTATLRDVIVEGAGETAWAKLRNEPARLDRLAEILTFREAPERIEQGLRDIGIEDETRIALMDRLTEFAKFTGAAHISAAAARAILPGLRQGLTYDKACTAAGFDHAARPIIDLTTIGNPVARKALSEAMKQVNAIVREWGVPDAIHVELARDVGKSAEEREEIRSGIEKRNKEKDKLRQQYEATVGRPPRTGEDLLRFELWKQQNGRCIYTDDEIHPDWIGAEDNRAQVDHILPWSRFGDDSFHNKVLVTARANQRKKGRTPFEWFSADLGPEDWDRFVSRVESSKSFRGYKKRNLLLKNAEELADKFRTRNLNDTRYAARALAGLLEQKYPPEAGKRRVFARPGAITSKLRQAWGVQDLKKTETGERREDDRHHALDAMVCAACTESALQRLTNSFKEAEKRGIPRELISMPLPWDGFREQARDAVANIFVARAERRRARGKAHDATIKQLRPTDDGQVIYERKAIDKLSEKDLDRIKDPDRNAALIAALRDWIAAGKPKDPERQPRSPKGDPIRKVRISTNDKDGVIVRHGSEPDARPAIVDRGDIVRTDVCRKRDKKGAWKFYLVPIYPHQVANAKDWPKPPDAAVRVKTPEPNWPRIDQTFEFVFSIYPLSYVEVTEPSGELTEGYMRSLDRSDGRITLSNHLSKTLTDRAATVTARNIRKFAVDRMGRRAEVKKEVRTWRGAACT